MDDVSLALSLQPQRFIWVHEIMARGWHQQASRYLRRPTANGHRIGPQRNHRGASCDCGVKPATRQSIRFCWPFSMAPYVQSSVDPGRFRHPTNR